VQNMRGKINFVFIMRMFSTKLKLIPIPKSGKTPN